MEQEAVGELGIKKKSMLPVRSEFHAFTVLHVLPQRKTELCWGFASKSSQILVKCILRSKKKGAWSGFQAFLPCHRDSGAVNDILGAASTHPPCSGNSEQNTTNRKQSKHAPKNSPESQARLTTQLGIQHHLIPFPVMCTGLN